MCHSIRQELCLSTLLCLLLAGSGFGQGLLQRFVPVDKVQADAAADYHLTENEGPWLIMAATFSGDGAEEQARALVMEFRSRYNLPAYRHDMTFNYSNENVGRGIDANGSRIRRRLKQNGAKREWAVLVGDFGAVDDARGQQLLKRIKSLAPEALATQNGRSAQNLSDLRRFQNALLARMGKGRQRGPMAKAFMTPNPLLPREYFVPKGVDDFIAKLNKGIKHSLLDCKGKYTVQVATFRGNSILQTSSTQYSGQDSRGSGLVEAAENAHLLTEELRKHDWEAYVFHDREQSIVTIGSFDRPGRRLADGRVVPTIDAANIIHTFGAAYDTPADPLNGDTAQVRRQREQALGQLAPTLTTKAGGQIASGLNPKHVKILRGRRLQRTIPMDINPQVIEVPKLSVSSSYFRG